MRKKISITLDRERFLRLDLNAMARFEEITGKSLFTIGEGLQEAKALRAVLFCCLKSGGEDLTIDQVGELIDIDNFTMISENLAELMVSSYGKSDSQTSEKK